MSQDANRNPKRMRKNKVCFIRMKVLKLLFLSGQDRDRRHPTGRPVSLTCTIYGVDDIAQLDIRIVPYPFIFQAFYGLDNDILESVFNFVGLVFFIELGLSLKRVK